MQNGFVRDQRVSFTNARGLTYRIVFTIWLQNGHVRFCALN